MPKCKSNIRFRLATATLTPREPQPTTINCQGGRGDNSSSAARCRRLTRLFTKTFCALSVRLVTIFEAVVNTANRFYDLLPKPTEDSRMAWWAGLKKRRPTLPDRPGRTFEVGSKTLFDHVLQQIRDAI